MPDPASAPLDEDALVANMATDGRMFGDIDISQVGNMNLQPLERTRAWYQARNHRIRKKLGGWDYMVHAVGGPGPGTDIGFVYEITAAPPGQEGKIGLVVRPGMKGFEEIEQAMNSTIPKAETEAYDETEAVLGPPPSEWGDPPGPRLPVGWKEK